jgi:hypothetical protein
MGNAHKHLFWPLRYPTNSLCTTNEVDTWPHVLLSYPPHLHALQIKRHNKAIWEICKLLISSPLSRCLILMNVGYFNNNPPDNTIPSWLLCSTQRCQCNARLRPHFLYVQGIPYLGSPPTQIDPSITIQFIEFAYTNDRYPEDRINVKITKYLPLINDIQILGWKVAPFLVISTGAKGTTRDPSIQTLKTTYKFKKSKIKETLININTIAIQHLSSIILHKRRLENNQPLPTT